jgi:hypothetical protein
LILPLAINGTVHRRQIQTCLNDFGSSRTINEPSDHGDENIDETVSANTLNDSLTIEKEINNEETPSQMTEIEISQQVSDSLFKAFEI